MKMNFAHSIELLQEKLYTWLDKAILLFPNFLIALLILVIFYWVSRGVAKLVDKTSSRFFNNHSLASFLATLSKICVFILGFLLALNILEMSKAFFSVLAGVGIVGIALGFAFQDIAANLISGIAIVLKRDRPFKVGDLIETNSYTGTVTEINLRATLLKTFDGKLVILPNKLIYEAALTNFTLTGQRRVDIALGISYGDDLNKVKNLVLEGLKNIEGKAKHKEIEFYFIEYGDSSINFEVRIWIPFNDQVDYMKVRSTGIMMIKEIFDANDITIPFPIRTLDFGIKGGEKLSPGLINN